MQMVGKVRRMDFREGMSVREIARRTAVSRNTVRTWLRASTEKEPRCRRTTKAGRLAPFHATLVGALKADALRSKKERRTGLALYREIRAADYGGGGGAADGEQGEGGEASEAGAHGPSVPGSG